MSLLLRLAVALLLLVAAGGSSVTCGGSGDQPKPTGGLGY